MKDNEIGEIPIQGLLGQGLLKEIPRSKWLNKDVFLVHRSRGKLAQNWALKWCSEQSEYWR
jgi:hypothetical protein